MYSGPPKTTSHLRRTTSAKAMRSTPSISALLTVLWVSACTTKTECVELRLSVEDGTMCDAAVVFVGEVSGLDVDQHTDPYGLLTTGTLEVEAAIQGNVGNEEDVLVRGGRVGTYEEYTSGYPFLEVGERYLFALAHPRTDGPGAIVGWRLLPDDACPSDEPALQASFKSICE